MEIIFHQQIFMLMNKNNLYNTPTPTHPTEKWGKKKNIIRNFWNSQLVTHDGEHSLPLCIDHSSKCLFFKSQISYLRSTISPFHHPSYPPSCRNHHQSHHHHHLGHHHYLQDLPKEIHPNLAPWLMSYSAGSFPSPPVVV